MSKTEYCIRCGNCIGQYDRSIQECGKCGLNFNSENPDTRPLNPDRDIYYDST